MLIEMRNILQFHDISMTTMPDLSIIMEMKLRTIHKFCEMEKMNKNFDKENF